MTDKVEFVHVVDAEGNTMPGFGSPVPSHWIDTDLLPKGAKRALEVEAAPADGIEELEERVAELEAENDALRAGLAAFTGQGEAPAGNASLEDWAAYAVAQGADEEHVKSRSRDQLREEFSPKA